MFLLDLGISGEHLVMDGSESQQDSRSAVRPSRCIHMARYCNIDEDHRLGVILDLPVTLYNIRRVRRIFIHTGHSVSISTLKDRRSDGHKNERDERQTKCWNDLHYVLKCLKIMSCLKGTNLMTNEFTLIGLLCSVLIQRMFVTSAFVMLTLVLRYEWNRLKYSEHLFRHLCC